MKLSIYSAVALLASAFQIASASVGFSNLTINTEGTLFLNLTNLNASCVVDSAHSFSWLYTNSSVSPLSDNAVVFPWQGAFPYLLREVTYIDGSNFTYYLGRSTNNLTVAGDVLVTPAVGGMHTVSFNETAPAPGVYSCGMAIGLGRLAARQESFSLIDAISKTRGASPFTLLLRDADGQFGNQTYLAGWYSQGLSGFNSSLFAAGSQPIRWRVIPEVKAGATVTKLTAILIGNAFVKADLAADEAADEIITAVNEDEEEVDADVEAEADAEELQGLADADKVLLPFPLRLFFGSNLVLNLKDFGTMLPLCLFEKVVERISGDAEYEIADEDGIYTFSYTATPPSELPDITFLLSNGEKLVISSDYLLNGSSGNFVGYKPCELPCAQAAEIRKFGCDAIFLGNRFLTNYALEFDATYPVGFRLQEIEL